MGTGLDGEEPARRKHGISRSSRWFTSEHICRRKASPGRRLGATVTAVPVASGEALSCPWKKLSVARARECGQTIVDLGNTRKRRGFLGFPIAASERRQPFFTVC